MKPVLDFFACLWNALGSVGAFFRTRASLATRLLAAESQLAMCKRRIEQKQHAKPRFSSGFRILWVVLSKLWVP